MPAPGTLFLLRHGQSVLNAQDRFTGLLDPPLSSIGEDEAARAGALLASASFSPDTVYTSTLTRTRDTARIVLDVLGDPGVPGVPVLAAWELNERSYGSLTGRARRELLSELGHGNSLRALCLVLDGLSHAEVEALNIPTGHPLGYRFAPDLVPLVPVGVYLNPLAARTAAALVAAAGGT